MSFTDLRFLFFEPFNSQVLHMKPEQTHTCLLVFEAREQLAASVPVGPREQHAQDRGHAVRRQDHILLRFVLDHTQKHLQAEIRALLSVRWGLRRRNAQRTNRHQHTQLQCHKHREGHTGSSPEEQRDGVMLLFFLSIQVSLFLSISLLMDYKQKLCKMKMKSKWCIYLPNTF